MAPCKLKAIYQKANLPILNRKGSQINSYTPK